MNFKRIAAETVAALERGSYTTATGATVDLTALMHRCLEGTRCYSPDELTAIGDRVLAVPPVSDQTAFEVVNETALQGAARLVASNDYQHIGVLNFASAKNPGGGFLGGAQAQEESLARSSGLYPSLLKCPEVYAYHRREKTLLYSDHMIFSPHCPVIRRDDGTWLDQPMIVSFISSAAPNLGALLTNEPESVRYVPYIFAKRMGKLLALAVEHGCDALVLGAWGCGVFKNDPFVVAPLFMSHLRSDFFGRFKKVVFSVLDRTKEQSAVRAFERVLE